MCLLPPMFQSCLCNHAFYVFPEVFIFVVKPCYIPKSYFDRFLSLLFSFCCCFFSVFISCRSLTLLLSATTDLGEGEFPLPFPLRSVCPGVFLYFSMYIQYLTFICSTNISIFDITYLYVNKYLINNIP